MFKEKDGRIKAEGVRETKEGRERRGKRKRKERERREKGEKSAYTYCILVEAKVISPACHVASTHQI